MIITIHGKNLEITEAITNAVEKSLTRIERFKKFIKPNTRAKVEIRSYPDKTYKITANINLPFNKHLQAQVKEQDLYIAIKQLVNPLTQQLNHLKTQVGNKGAIGVGEAISENVDQLGSDYTVEELDDSLSLTDSFDDYDDEF